MANEKTCNHMNLGGEKDMGRSIRDAFVGFGGELLEGIRERNYARIDEAVFKESVVGIEKATAALFEAEVEDQKIIYLLQKYWDLRLSEAKEFLQQEKYHSEK